MAAEAALRPTAAQLEAIANAPENPDDSAEPTHSASSSFVAVSTIGQPPVTSYVALTPDDKLQLMTDIRAEINHMHLQGLVSDIMESKITQRLQDYQLDTKIKAVVTDYKIDDRITQALTKALSDPNGAHSLVSVRDRIQAIENRNQGERQEMPLLEYKSICNLEKLGGQDVQFSLGKRDSRTASMASDHFTHHSSRDS